jgi:hypothetical protein
MQCTCCGQIKPRKGCKTIPGQGLACAECAPALLPSAPKKATRSPEGRPKAESKDAWKPWTVERKPTEPAQAAETPGVVRLMPAYDPRYGVDPAQPVIGGFASMGIGRYLENAS